MSCRCRICGCATDCGENLCPICESPEELTALLKESPSLKTSTSSC
ncbi:MAG: hypothetical protein ACE5NN_05980 [Candidatus Bathyarchaeia archaeon]